LVCTAQPNKETQKQKILEMGDGGVHGYLSNRSEATPGVGCLLIGWLWYHVMDVNAAPSEQLDGYVSSRKLTVVHATKRSTESTSWIFFMDPLVLLI